MVPGEIPGLPFCSCGHETPQRPALRFTRAIICVAGGLAVSLSAMPAPIADSPPTSFARFVGPQTTIQTMISQIRGQRGERSVLVRGVVEHITRELRGKDYLSEILAIRNYVAERVVYRNDPLTTEWTKDPQRIAEEIVRHGKATGDCDDIAAFICALARGVGRECELVTVGFGRPGHYSHVFARVKEPKSGKWIVLDPVAGTTEGAMLRKVKTQKFWRID